MPSSQAAETQRAFQLSLRLGVFATLRWIGNSLQGTSFHESLLHDRQISGGQNAQTSFKPNGRQRANALHVGDGFLVEKGQMSEGHFQFAAATLFGDGNVNYERARGVQVISDENHAGAGLGHHAHVNEPDLTVAWIHLPSRMSRTSCSTSRVGKISAHS